MKRLEDIAKKLFEQGYNVGNTYVKLSRYVHGKRVEHDFYIDIKAYNPKTKTLLMFHDGVNDDAFLSFLIEFYLKHSDYKIKTYKIENEKIMPEYVLEKGIFKDYKRNEEKTISEYLKPFA